MIERGSISYEIVKTNKKVNFSEFTQNKGAYHPTIENKGNTRVLLFDEHILDPGKKFLIEVPFAVVGQMNVIFLSNKTDGEVVENPVNKITIWYGLKEKC
ncbi:hypothetical protein [Kordia sp.]|uniref:hypothetical protein n=1 Tax=Kordia sp. TaxID=1965332 RepID=UPI0025BFC2BD|nr:hypothetical protein [Kordia sp.]MCH2194396.1 hypothetical protein [Kordia sp.]